MIERTTLWARAAESTIREDPGMGTTRKYVVIDPATGKLDCRIFSEQAIYDKPQPVTEAQR
jgi:hypothetical protein